MPDSIKARTQAVTSQLEFNVSISAFVVFAAAILAFVKQHKTPPETWLIEDITAVACLLIVALRLYIRRALLRLSRDITWPIETLLHRIAKPLEFTKIPVTPMPLEEVRRFEETMRVMAQQTELTQQAAHDIRSPLSALNVLVRRSKELSESDRHLVERATNRIREITDDLLTPAAPVSFDGWRLLREVVGLKQVRQACEIHVHGEAGITLALERSDLERIISNLIDNSIEASSTRIDITLENTRGFARIVVKDNGVGIPHASLTQVSFKKFSYGKTAGHGLALWWARRKIEAWGGQLLLLSKLGAGSSVILLVPTQK